MASGQSAAVSVFHRLQELPESTGPLLLPEPGPPRGSKNIGQALGERVADMQRLPSGLESIADRQGASIQPVSATPVRAGSGSRTSKPAPTWKRGPPRVPNCALTGSVDGMDIGVVQAADEGRSASLARRIRGISEAGA